MTPDKWQKGSDIEQGGSHARKDIAKTARTRKGIQTLFNIASGWPE